jgi:hypothetical protein
VAYPAVLQAIVRVVERAVGLEEMILDQAEMAYPEVAVHQLEGTEAEKEEETEDRLEAEAYWGEMEAFLLLVLQFVKE